MTPNRAVCVALQLVAAGVAASTSSSPLAAPLAPRPDPSPTARARPFLEPSRRDACAALQQRQPTGVHPIGPPFLVHSEQTAQVPDAPYSSAHPAARMRGWWPVDSADQPLATPGKRHLIFSLSWGNVPFFALPPQADTCVRVQAVFSEMRRHGWAAWQVHTPAVSGSAGALLQPGPPGTFPDIPTFLAESVSWVRSQYGAESVVALGVSGGGISWAWVAGRPPGTFPFPGWRPDGVVMLESAPSLDRLADDVNIAGGPQYFGAADWTQVPLATKLAASPLPGLATGAGGAVALVASYPPDSSLPNGLGPAAFLALWQGGGPISGYANPHAAAGGLGLESDLTAAARSAPFLVHWGDGIALNPTGSPGLVEPGKDPAFALETRLFLEQALP